MPHAKVDGRKVYYERFDARSPIEVGKGRASRPLLLITGLSASCRGWHPLQVPAFSESRDLVIYDHRGAGQSEDTGEPFTTADLASDAAGLLDALEIEQADVLGAFMGGMVAQELALSHADRVHRLVLVGTYARPDAKRRLLLDGWAELAREGHSMVTMTRERMLWTLQDETFEQTDLIDAMVEFIENEPSAADADLFARQCDACRHHDALGRLRGIRQPTLVVCGRHDQLTPPKFHRELAEAIPDAHMVSLMYGGHLVMAESAERFNQSVLQFLGD